MAIGFFVNREFKEFREIKDNSLNSLTSLNSLFCVSQLTPRLSREQRLLADFAEAERGRVAEGKPMANGQRLTANLSQNRAVRR